MLCVDKYPTAALAEDRAPICHLAGFRPAPVVAKARWALMATIAFSAILTLIGQPDSFWRDPATAMRFDGLPIHATTNPSFEFFLGSGAVPFVVTTLLYMAAAFFAVSRLPRMIALMAIFAVIFVHDYGITNWLVVRFHLGIGGSISTAGVALGTLLSFAILPTSARPRAVINAWRWLMVAALFVDFTNTLLGQPASYWHDLSTVHEGNALSRFSLLHGWVYYLGLNIAEAVVEFALVTFLPIPAAFVCVFAFTLGSFVGASNWFFYVWRMGCGVIIAYAVILGTLLALAAFRKKDDPGARTVDSLDGV